MVRKYYAFGKSYDSFTEAMEDAPDHLKEAFKDYTEEMAERMFDAADKINNENTFKFSEILPLKEE